ncbi:MAG TPA: HD domain-containing protein [Spirochaetales bacterium]|nr:HD domain-containing protein [Spirochaetales bacterium]
MSMVTAFIAECTEPVRDPLWKNIRFPRSFETILTHPVFIKLGRILQLGPTQLVYPGATHSRRAHSIGVYAMALRILQAVSGIDDYVTHDGIRSFLAAALCHDVGHFPYTHSLKELPLESHEVLTGKLLCNEMADALVAAGAHPEKTAAIIDESIPTHDPEILLYRGILSGILDPDKLDYLNRDAWACGVPYGVQDVDFIFQHITIEHGSLAVDMRGVMSVEGLLFSKYEMYRAVYWHRMVRSATAMIKQGVFDALNDGIIEPQALYNLDDHEFFSLFLSLPHASSQYAERVRNGALFALLEEHPYTNDFAPLLSLQTRSNIQNELKKHMRVSDIIIDITEPITLESDLRVAGTGKTVTEVSTVFNHDLIRAFENDLRRVRIYSSEKTTQPILATIRSLLIR